MPSMKEYIKRKKILDIIKILLYLLILVSALYFFYMGQNLNQLYYIGFVLSVAAFVAAVYIKGKVDSIKRLVALIQNWGNESQKERNIEDIRKNFYVIGEKEDRGFFIDDQTWQDINMDEVYSVVDRTFTNPGEQILYQMFRVPLFDEDRVRDRTTYINELQQNINLTRRIQMILGEFKKQKVDMVSQLLWGSMPQQTRLRPVFSLMALLVILLPLIALFSGKLDLLMILVPITGINIYIHTKVKVGIATLVPSVRYINSLINMAENMGRIRDTKLDDTFERLKKSGNKCRKLRSKTWTLGLERIDPFGLYDYVNVVFLIDVRSFFGALDLINRYKEDLRRIYMDIGELDALVSIASYRAGLDGYCEPVFVKGDSVFDVQGIGHPLIKKPVVNSISTSDKNVMITGSNMSGKSTFLRTVGANVIMAQGICTCIAHSYRASFFRVITSISQSDNLLGGKSYYLAEAESLLRIIRSIGDGPPVFAIIDELFRGTNSQERISAAAQVLNYIGKGRAKVFVATHDLELADMTGELYNVYYFRERVGNKGLEFDYLLNSGISPTRNAVKILEFLGYPEEIVKRARV